MLKCSKRILHLLALESPGKVEIQIDHTSTAVNCRRLRNDLVDVIKERNFDSVFVKWIVFDKIKDLLLDHTRCLSVTMITIIHRGGIILK